MGNYSGSTKEHKNNEQELVVFGYIRKESSKCYSSIPIDIQKLCNLFYYQDWFVFITIGSLGCQRMDFNSIQSINIKTAQTFNFALKNLDVGQQNEPENILRHEHFDKMYYGECSSQNVNLPSWIINKYQDKTKEIDLRHRYNILYRIGGAYGKNLKLSKTSNCIIYNAEQFKYKKKNKEIINGYYCNLPELHQPLTSVSSIMDNNKNTIYTIGRSEYGKNYIYKLDLNKSKLEWDRMDNILEKKIFGVAMNMINNTHFNDNNDSIMMICGGRNINRNLVNDVNIINLTKHKVFNMESMNKKRGYFNCVSYKKNDNTFICGGGYEQCDTLEIFDINKNQWIMIPQKTNYYHETNSCLWMDNSNQNIVWICGKKLGYEQLRDLGYIEFCDLRENTNKFQVYQNKSIAKLFDIKGSSINDKWESRKFSTF